MLLEFSLEVTCSQLMWKVKWPVLHFTSSTSNIRVCPCFRSPSGFPRYPEKNYYLPRLARLTASASLCNLTLLPLTAPVTLGYLLVRPRLLVPQGLCTHCALCLNAIPASLLNLASTHCLGLNCCLFRRASTEWLFSGAPLPPHTATIMLPHFISFITHVIVWNDLTSLFKCPSRH